MNEIRFTRLAQAAGILTAFVGGMVLTGWLWNLPALKGILPGFVTMKANTAVCFVLIGLSLGLWPGAKERPILNLCGRFFAVICSVVGFLTLVEFLSGSNLGIDEFLFHDDPGAVRTSHPGRMSPVTTWNFFSLGIAVLLLYLNRSPAISLSLGCAAIGLSAISLTGYLYGVEFLQGLSAHTPLALHTAAAFVVLGLGLVLAHPRRGFVAVLRREIPHISLIRRLLLAAFVLPPFLGWTLLRYEKSGYYNSRFTLTLFSVLLAGIFIALIYWNALSIIRAQARLREVEEDRDRFFTLSMDMLCIAGGDGYFKTLNPAWEKTLGYSAGELLSRPYLDFIHPEDRQATVDEAGKLATGIDTLYFENRYRGKDGTYHWLAWTARAMHGKEQRIYAAARDISDRRRMEEELKRVNAQLREQVEATKRANRELEAFSYSVSHDLRAPLRHINGFVDLLQRHAAPALDDKGRNHLKTIARASRDMGLLIDDLLTFSRMGRVSLQMTHVSLDRLVRRVLEELQEDLQGRSIEWKVGPLPEVRGDPSLLKLVYANLLSNAVKYTRPRPRAHIEIGCRPDGPTGRVFFVRDDGVGFDMQYVHKLFGVFQRLHSAEEFEGTGIGLANVRRIVERHSGRVWAEAVPDQGASFFFTLPETGKESG